MKIHRHIIAILCLAVMGLSVIGFCQDAVRTSCPTNAEVQLPKSAKDFCERGTSFLRAGEYDKAENDFSEAIRLDPTRVEAYQGRAIGNHLNERFDQAFADIEAAIKLDGANAQLYSNRGLFYGKQHDYAKAIPDLDHAIKLEETNALYYQARSGIYYAMKAFDKALPDVSRAIALNPDNPNAYKARGLVYSHTGKWELELADLNTCLHLNPGDVQALGWRADAYVSKGQYEKAVVDFQEALRLAPTNDAAARNELGWFRATCPEASFRSAKEAIELATKACELTSWGEASYVDTLAAAYAEAGEFDKAVSYERKAMALSDQAETSEGDANRRKRMKERLSLYEKRQPFREQPEMELVPKVNPNSISK